MTTTENQPTKEELLGATTPETVAALMAKYPDAPQEGVTAVAESPAPAEGAAPGTDEQQPNAAEPPPQAPPEPTGIATKSGAGVLPYHVLQHSRDAERQARQRAAEAERERDQANQRIADLQGRTVPEELLSAAQEMTEAEINDLQYINPKAHKAVMLARGIASAPAAEQPAPPATPATAQEPSEEQVAAADEAAAALNGRTLLARLAQSGGALWDRAVEIDAGLRMDPSWTNKPLDQRFAEVEQRVAQEMGVQITGPAKPSAPAPAPTAAPEIESFRPNTSSDLISGAVPDKGNGITEQADGMALTRRFLSMTDEQIQAQMRRALGG